MVGKVMVKLLNNLAELPAGWVLVFSFPTHLPQGFKFKWGSQNAHPYFEAVKSYPIHMFVLWLHV